MPNIFFQDDQWFNLTSHDMKRTLVNAGMKYHRPQVIPDTSLPNSTSPPSPAPMKLIQFPPEMDENWVRYGLAKLGQISRTKLAEDAVLCVHNTASALNR